MVVAMAVDGFATVWATILFPAGAFCGTDWAWTWAWATSGVAAGGITVVGNGTSLSHTLFGASLVLDSFTDCELFLPYSLILAVPTVAAAMASMCWRSCVDFVLDIANSRAQHRAAFCSSNRSDIV